MSDVFSKRKRPAVMARILGSGNRRRDREVNRLLRRAGWRVLRIWEHALTKTLAPRTAARVRRALDPNALSLRT